MEKSMMEIHAVNGVLEQLGLSPARLSASWTYTGQEPPLVSSVALALAARTAVMAQALAVAEFWSACGGTPQTVTVDRHNGLFALCSGLFQSSRGHDMSIAHGAKAALSNFYATRDGRWFHPMGTYPELRDGALDLLQCANSPEAISRAIRNRDALELEEAFADAGLAGSMARSKSEWIEHPQGQALGAAPLITIEKIADGPAGGAGARPLRPLGGSRVLDFTHVIAGPVLVRTLAEHGADCLRISAPAHSDPPQFLIDTDWGKRSAYVDLNDPGGLNHLRKLIREGDIFVQSWRPGAIAKWGLTAEELADGHTGLIHVSVDAWGATGPWAMRKGFEQLAQTVTGVALEEGGDGKPHYVPTALLADYLAGYLGAAGTVAAMTRRQCEGGSYRVRVSLARVTMWAQSLSVPDRAVEAAFPPSVFPPFIERESAFGMLRHMAPFARFSTTQADWRFPPAPSGCHDANWLARETQELLLINNSQHGT